MHGSLGARDAVVGRKVAAGALVLLCVGALACDRSVDASASAFATPGGAIAALSDAIRRDDPVAARVILGGAADVVLDPNDALMGASAERVLLEDLGTGCVLLRVGFVAYRLPIALARHAGAWRFVDGTTDVCRSDVAPLG